MKVSDWHGAYRDGWQSEIVPEAFAHPAKYSRSLIRRIYQHARDEGWLPVGSTVLDPFGGVALGALDAMHLGLNWCGVELEARFQSLGQQNIARWNARYSTLPGWGTATLIQGDSRQLTALVSEAVGCVSSPPFVNSDNRGDRSQLDKLQEAVVRDGRGHAGRLGPSIGQDYGTDPANLGNMKAGDFDACLASPPFTSSLQSQDVEWENKRQAARGRNIKGYGHLGSLTDWGTDPANLGNMKAGDFDACLASPPYAESLASDDPDKRGGLFHDPKRYGDKTLTATYGQTDGQLGAMPAGGFEAAVSSPPYDTDTLSTFSQKSGKANGTGQIGRGEFKVGRCLVEANRQGYSLNADNLGNATDFWTAARTIVEQVYTVLRPGAHAIWVLKAYVRDKRIVDFPDQWRQMCEACGFETLHVHRAWLVEDHGAQGTLDGGVKHKRTERKSFFRRLAESKGSPRIDYEIVLCQVKPVGTGSQSGQASACVSSPPYENSVKNEGSRIKWTEFKSDRHKYPSCANGTDRIGAGYGTDPANLGNLKAGDFDAAVKPLNSNGKGDTQ